MSSIFFVQLYIKLDSTLKSNTNKKHYERYRRRKSTWNYCTFLESNPRKIYLLTLVCKLVFWLVSWADNKLAAAVLVATGKVEAAAAAATLDEPEDSVVWLWP